MGHGRKRTCNAKTDAIPGADLWCKRVATRAEHALEKQVRQRRPLSPPRCPYDSSQMS